MDAMISIVIPTLNEAGSIVELIKDLRHQTKNTEIIIADGGSTDGTLEYDADLATVLQVPRGRAAQMNAGAAAATGTIVWFLHADCKPPADAEEMIHNALRDNQVVGGGFRWGLSGEKWYYGLVTMLAHVKNVFRRNLFGDMGIFVRAEVFREMNGYAEIPFLEDVEFNNRLKKRGKTVIINKIIYSSDRRLLVKGPMRTFVKNHIMKTAYKLGFSPKYLRKYY
jgi:rSAM/selenodomain-associated transferase 2